MNLDWLDLATAFGLYLVIEGILPFLSPQGMKRAMAMFASLPDSQLRRAGLIMMACGVALIWLVRSGG